jgi:hypothetical protein
MPVMEKEIENNPPMISLKEINIVIEAVRPYVELIRE